MVNNDVISSLLLHRPPLWPNPMPLFGQTNRGLILGPMDVPVNGTAQKACQFLSFSFSIQGKEIWNVTGVFSTIKIPFRKLPSSDTTRYAGVNTVLGVLCGVKNCTALTNLTKLSQPLVAYNERVDGLR